MQCEHSRTPRGQWGSDFHRPVRGFRILARQADRLPAADVIGARSGLELVGRAHGKWGAGDSD